MSGTTTALTVEYGLIRLYIDGELYHEQDRRDTVSDGAEETLGPAGIPTRNGFGTDTSQIDVTDVMAFDGAMNEAEISAQMASATPIVVSGHDNILWRPCDDDAGVWEDHSGGDWDVPAFAQDWTNSFVADGPDRTPTGSTITGTSAWTAPMPTMRSAVDKMRIGANVLDTSVLRDYTSRLSTCSRVRAAWRKSPHTPVWGHRGGFLQRRRDGR